MWRMKQVENVIMLSAFNRLKICRCCHLSLVVICPRCHLSLVVIFIKMDFLITIKKKRQRVTLFSYSGHLPEILYLNFYLLCMVSDFSNAIRFQNLQKKM